MPRRKNKKVSDKFPFERILESYPTTARKIIENIPMHERVKVGAINKQFYETVCNFDKLKYMIKINGSKYDNGILPKSLLKSILKSHRQFDMLKLEELVLSADNLKFLMKVADKYGKDIVKLKMKNCTIDYEKDYLLFGQLLEKLPTINEWVIERAFLGNKRDPYNLPELDIQPVLMNLRKLEIHSIFDLYCFFWSQFIVSDTIQEYSYSDSGSMAMKDFILRQSNIRSFKIIGSTHGRLSRSSYFKHMKNLEVLELQEGEDEFVQELIRDHPTLQNFFIGLHGFWNEQTLTTIYNHAEQFQSINVDMNDDNYLHLFELPRLKNLVELKFGVFYDFHKFDALMDFTKLNMPSIKTLQLAWRWGKWENFDVNGALENIANNWENIEDFDYNGCLSLFNSFKDWNTIDIDRVLKNFRNVKKLTLTHSIKVDNEEKYPKMEELKFDDVGPSQMINMTKAFPNLKKLRVTGCREGQNSDEMFNALQSLASVNEKLKDLSMELYFKEAPTMSAHDGFEIISKLCRNVPKFRLEIEIYDKKFYDGAVAYMEQVEDEFCRASTTRNANGGSFLLRNFKY